MSFIRDPNSGAVINNDEQYLQAVIARRQDRKDRLKLVDQIDELKEQLHDIKNFIQAQIGNK